MNDQPKPLAVAWSIARARRTRQPRPTGDGFVQSDDFAEVLARLRTDGVDVLPSERAALARFRYRMEEIDPDTLSADGSARLLAQPLQRRGTVARGRRDSSAGEATVLRVPGAFDTPWATVGGESLSLNDIEHGKIRRFEDPRIHAALVCGSVSCPTLRYEPFGDDLGAQLDDQMRSFLAERWRHGRPGHRHTPAVASLPLVRRRLRPARGECQRGSPPVDTILHGRSHSGCPTTMPPG